MLNCERGRVINGQRECAVGAELPNSLLADMVLEDFRVIWRRSLFGQS